MLGGGFDENVSGYSLYVSLMTDSVRHANEELKTLYSKVYLKPEAMFEIAVDS